MTHTQLHVLVAEINWPPETFLQRLIDGLLEQEIIVTVATVQRPKPQTNLHWLPVRSWNDEKVWRLIYVGYQMIKAQVLAPKDVRIFQSFVSQHTERSTRWRSWFRLLPFAGKRWDVIYFPWNNGAIERSALFDLGIPVVISCRGSQINISPHNPKHPELINGLRKSFANATIVHCVSEHIKQEALNYGLESSKAWIIRPAVDIDFFYPAPKGRPQDGFFRIVMTGSLAWVKGYEYALIAISYLISQGVPIHLTIIGDGQEYQRILYTCHDLQIADSVCLAGKLLPIQVREQLHQADVFLLASLSEGISNAVLEAMACGLPIVTTECGGMREAVTDGIEGFVIPTREPQQIADRLAYLAHEPEVCRRMGKYARERVVREFSIPQQIEQFCNLFKEATKR